MSQVLSVFGGSWKLLDVLLEPYSSSVFIYNSIYNYVWGFFHFRPLFMFFRRENFLFLIKGLRIESAVCKFVICHIGYINKFDLTLPDYWLNLGIHQGVPVFSLMYRLFVKSFLANLSHLLKNNLKTHLMQGDWRMTVSFWNKYTEAAEANLCRSMDVPFHQSWMFIMFPSLSVG